MRPTPAQLRLIQTMMQDPNARHWGYALQETADMPSGQVYPMLLGWRAKGYLVAGWEDPANTGGRPARRYYRITEEGREVFARALRDKARSSA